MSLVQPRERVWFAHAIRGPACLLVVFAHLFDLFPNAPGLVAQIAHFEPVAGLPTVPWFPLLEFLARLHISTGALGVMLFFLVSGFVIPFSLNHGTPGGFFARRFFRLYPTLWACLFITLAMVAISVYFQGAPFPYGAGTVTSNALLVTAYTPQFWIEPVFWSLAVEELFYLIAATAAWRGLLASRVVILLVAVGLTVTCVVTDGASNSVLSGFGLNAMYVIFILIGMVFHYVYQRRWAVRDGLLIGAAIFGLWVVAIRNGGIGTVLADVYLPTSALALAIFGGLYLLRHGLPYWIWLDRLSNISYPLYLLHGVNGYIVMRAVYILTGNYYVSLVAALAVTIAVATAIHHFVEVPTNNFGRKVSRRLQARRTRAGSVTEPQPRDAGAPQVQAPLP